MAEGSYNLGGDEVKEESSWRYPLIIFFVTLVLCIIFLYHYVGPDVEEIQGNKPRPTIADENILLTLGRITFAVPANYTVFPRDRRDGERESLNLYASWPRMEGYVPARRIDFVENASNARRVDIIIINNNVPFTEEERLTILYRPHVVDQDGSPYDHGLTRYTFRQGQGAAETPASGYADKEMLIGKDALGNQAVIFCYPGSLSDIVAPECYREFDLVDKVSVKYRFKRPYLAEWQQIDSRTRELVMSFTDDIPQ